MKNILTAGVFAVLFAAFGAENWSVGVIGTSPAQLAKPVTPGKEWEKGKPGEHGFDPEILAKVPDYIRAKNLGTTGLMVVSGGQEIFAYGDIAEVSYVASCRNSVLSMMYGKHVRNGTITLS